ncbi:FMN-dependent NADH-azoreductase [Motilibacter aurantiacus]|uniref:FMN-dependent NADH-azoreductase n=1 Tax=Motilibacter aurantiacus TaxID=2714955 RepID=UPI00140B52CF|nr:NAD(P)H-dependent oxidoreductase [Motilibacter aurantiacus]NHC46254.1 FMN-dependent NADH-azoreductase [Motilibacter aurantiacus]
MAHLLHLDSSMRTEGSRSRKLSAHFANAWRAAHPDGAVTYRDLAARPLPHLDQDAFLGNVLAPSDRTPAQQAARDLTEEVVNELLAADEVVIGLPLYNFSAPTTFKAWTDRIVVPGLTTGESGGLLGHVRMTFTTARGGGYGPGTPREGWDHREPWLRHALSAVGITDVRFIDTELTLARESPAMAALDLGALEDKSLADAHAAIDALFAERAAA